MRSKFRLPLVILLSFFLLVGSLHADVLYYRAGEVAVGRVIGQTGDSIYFAMSSGTKSIPKRSILRIQYNLSPEEEEKIENAAAIKESLDWEKNLKEVLRVRQEEADALHKEKVARAKQEKGFFHDEILEINKRKRLIAVERSAFVPGAGQMYKGQSRRGWAIIGLSLTSALALYYAKQSYTKYSDTYNQRNATYLLALYPHHSLALSYYLYSNAQKDRNIMSTNVGLTIGAAAFLGVLYLINVGDAYYSDPAPESTDSVGYFRTRRDGLSDGLSDSRVLTALSGYRYGFASPLQDPPGHSLNFSYTFSFP